MLKKGAHARCANCSIPDDHSAQKLLTKHTSPNNPQLRAIETAKQIILTRINSIDPNEVKDAEADLDYCIQQWVNEGYDVWYDLGFPQPDTPTPLIHPVGVINPVWGNAGFDAPTAMRTVDGDCQVAVLQRRNDGEADDV